MQMKAVYTQLSCARFNIKRESAFTTNNPLPSHSYELRNVRNDIYSASAVCFFPNALLI